MNWEIILHEKHQYIEVVTKGTADTNGSLEMAKAVSENMQKNKCRRVLIDHRNISEVSGRIAAIYYRPQSLSDIGTMPGIKIAEIIKKEHVGHFRFLETVFSNNGFQVAMFLEQDKAIDWLLD